MCISTAPANISNTRGLIGRTTRDEEEIHTLVYQNTVRSQKPGPNAMFITIPALELGPENMVDTSDYPDFLADMVKNLQPRSKALSLSMPMTRGGAVVFEKGSFTVIIARDSVSLVNALDLVPESKRPIPPQAQLDWADTDRAEHFKILCCWNGNSTITPEPVMFWYRPTHPDELYFPAVDNHKGGAPVQERVLRDHQIIVGDRKDVIGYHARAMERVISDVDLNNEIRSLLPPFMMLETIKGMCHNGDIVFDRKDYLKMSVREVHVQE